MKNNLTHQKSIDFLKRVFFSKDCIPVYYILGAMFVFINMTLLPILFDLAGGSFDANFACTIYITFGVIGIFILLSVTTPFYMKNKNTELTDEDKPQVSKWKRMLLLWIPFCLYIVAQTLLIGICALLTASFNQSFIVALFTCVASCILIFAWILLLTCLYFCTRSAFWYFVGFLVLNFAPLIISGRCYDIYNLNPLVPYEGWNPLQFNLFILSVLFVFHPIYLALVSSVIVGISAFVWRLCKKYSAKILAVLSPIYKIITIILIALSCGFMFSGSFKGKNYISTDYIICFLITALLIAILCSFFAFRKARLLVPMSITVLTVFLSSALILEGIPASTHKEAYFIPEREKIESISLRFSSTYKLEIENEHIDEFIGLHKILFKKFEEGHLFERTSSGYKEPECLADLWENATVNYNLNNGESLYREYRHLYDSAFNEFFVEFFKSDIYADSLKKERMDNPEKLYYYDSENGRGKSCALPKSCAEKLLATYLDELKNADNSAFYEEYEIIEFTGKYEKSRKIYVPLSFSETRKLAKEYLNTYAEN